MGHPPGDTSQMLITCLVSPPAEHFRMVIVYSDSPHLPQSFIPITSSSSSLFQTPLELKASPRVFHRSTFLHSSAHAQTRAWRWRARVSVCSSFGQERRWLRMAVFHPTQHRFLSTNQAFLEKGAKESTKMGQKSIILFGQEDTWCHKALCFNIEVQF